MKLQAKFLRLAGAVLTAGLTLGVLWPLMTADATTIDIDSSAFADPTVTVRTVYVWQQGLPAYAGDNAEPKACPVLFTWDDKYYWKVSKEFAKCCKNNIGFYANMIKHGYSTNKKDSGYINGSFDADGSMPHGNFCQNLGYTGTTLSSLKSTIDVDALRSAGSYLTFTKPEGVPELTAVRGSGDSVAVSSGNHDSPERIAFSSAVRFFTASARSSDRGSMSLVSVGSGSFRLNSILIVFHSPSGILRSPVSCSRLSTAHPPPCTARRPSSSGRRLSAH